MNTTDFVTYCKTGAPVMYRGHVGRLRSRDLRHNEVWFESPTLDVNVKIEPEERERVLPVKKEASE